MGINRQCFRTGIARFSCQSRRSPVCFPGLRESTRGAQCTGTDHLRDKLALSTEFPVSQGLISHVQSRPNTALASQDKGFQGTNPCSLLLSVGLGQTINQRSSLAELAANCMNPAIDNSETHASFQELGRQTLSKAQERCGILTQQQSL